LLLFFFSSSFFSFSYFFFSLSFYFFIFHEVWFFNCSYSLSVM
jgi:hypothetical protein